MTEMNHAEERQRLEGMLAAFDIAYEAILTGRERFVCHALHAAPSSQARRDARRLVQRALGRAYTLTEWVRDAPGGRVVPVSARASLRRRWIRKIQKDILARLQELNDEQ